MGIYNPPTPASIGAVPTARQVIAGTNMTGGGALSSDVTLNSTGSGGGGNFTLIADVVTSGSQGTIDFSSIPNTYKHLMLMGIARTSAAANADDVALFFNNDTTVAHYGTLYIQGANGTVSSGGNNNTAPLTAVGNSTAANYVTPFQIWIPQYLTTSFYKTANGIFGQQGNSSSMGQRNLLWLSTAAINEITLKSVTGGATFVNGLEVSLYGLN